MNILYHVRVPDGHGGYLLVAFDHDTLDNTIEIDPLTCPDDLCARAEALAWELLESTITNIADAAREDGYYEEEEDEE